jgi:hypothetical protein
VARSVPRPRRMVAILVFVCGLVALSVFPGAVVNLPARKATADTLPYQVSSDTLKDLEDVQPGDHVKVVIQSTVPGATGIKIGSNSLMRYCPVPFPGTPDSTTLNNMCASPGVAGSWPVDMPRGGFLSDPDGRFEFTLIIPPDGDNDFPASPPRTNEVNCTPGHPCSLGFSYTYRPPGGSITTVYDATSLSFTPKEPNSLDGCTAEKEGKFVDALGPFRMVDSEIAWVRDRCGGTKAPDLDLTVMDDVTARDTFRQGQGDVFFGAGGVTSEEDTAAAAKRKAVPVPLGLNAMVLAVKGFYGAPSSSAGTAKRPATIDDIKLTAKQFADLLIEPLTAFSNGPYAADILATNPEPASIRSTLLDAVSVGAYSTPEVGHSLTTRYLANRAPDVWKYPDNVTYGNDRGKPIGELWRLDKLNPGNSSGMPLVGDRVGLSKMVDNDFGGECINLSFTNATDGCLNFILTDAATAAYFKLPVAKIENGAGQFVAPTAQSMAAAVGSMKPLADGSLVPDPAANVKDAYPLTFLEYAYAPAETKLNSSCQPVDADKLSLIKNVLTYTTGDGQRHLGEGLQTLPASMQDAATTAIGKIGAERKSCGKDNGGGGGGGNPGSGSDNNGSSDNSGSSDSDNSDNGDSSPGAAGNHPTRPVTTAGQQSALQAAQETRIPLFAGMAALVLLIPLSALALTNALTSGTAFGSSGRPLPPPLDRVAHALTVWTRRLIRKLPFVPRGSA